MRRFFIGLISGGFVAAVGLVIVSQIAAPPLAQQADAEISSTVTGGVANDSARSASDAADLVIEPTPDTQTPVAEAEPEAPAVAASGAASDGAPPAEPAPLIVASGAASDARPAVAVPETETSAVSEPMAAAPLADTPVVPEASAPQIDTPSVAAAEENAAEPIIAPVPDESTTAAVDPVAAPVLAQPTAPLTDVPQPRPSAEAADRAAPPAADSTARLGPAAPDAPTAPGADAPPSLADLPPPPPLTPQEEAALAPAPDAVAEPQVEPASPETVLPDVAGPAPDVAVVVPAPEPVVPSVINVDAAPSVLQTDTPLIDSASELPATPSLRSAGEGVIVNRAAQTEPVDTSPVLPEVALEGQPPIDRFAAPFENPGSKPLFSIVLIDTGEAALDRMAVASLPFAVSVAIDPLAPDAAAHAALYRAGGKEVLMLASGIPDGANPADLEQTFQALEAALPEAVAVVDTETAQFQDNRPLATQIVPILAAQGRGLLTWDRGLNAADQVARREGLASAVIFRRIDGDGEAAPAIRRYLDRAAFKAAQEGQVTVIGAVRAETVAALLEWTIEGRASSVAIAPVSAQLALR